MKYLGSLAVVGVFVALVWVALQVIPQHGAKPDAGIATAIKFFEATKKGDTTLECKTMSQGMRDSLFGQQIMALGGVSPEQCVELLAGGGKFQVAYHYHAKLVLDATHELVIFDMAVENDTGGGTITAADTKTCQAAYDKGASCKLSKPWMASLIKVGGVWYVDAIGPVNNS